MHTRVALITGGCGGIGQAIARRFVRDGLAVVIADLPQTDGAAVAEAIGGPISFVPVDVTDGEAVQAMVAATIAAHGRLDCAINNAGVEGVRASTADYPEAEWRRVFEINLNGVWHCMRHEIPAMLAGEGGSIVNIASVAGLVGYPGGSAYAASKHAVIGLTKSAALEYARKGLRINAVCPAYTRTPMVERLTEGQPQRESRLASLIPSGRLGTPDEIADAVAYLCGPSAGFMIGHALVLDGGLMAS